MNLRALKYLLRATGRNQKSLFYKACEARGNIIRYRGVIEFSNYCLCDCRYCGMRRSNEARDELGRSVKKLYRLTPDEIVDTSGRAYDNGVRSIILQSGEDRVYIRGLPVIIRTLRDKYPEMKLVSCIGWQPRDTYQDLKDAGLDMVILKYETMNEELYRKMKGVPCGAEEQSRHNLLEWLKNELRIQVSSGCIAGLPTEGLDYDVYEDIAQGIFWLKRLRVDGVSVSPFIPHDKSPLRHMAPCPKEIALNTIAVMRLAFPQLPIPAVSAFGLLSSEDAIGTQIEAIMAGANVVTVNCTPGQYRKDYCIYTTNRNIVSLETLARVKQGCGTSLRMEAETRDLSPSPKSGQKSA